MANQQGDPAGALRILDTALSLQAQLPDARLGALLAMVRGSAQHSLGRLKESRAALLGALEVFRQADSPGELADAYSQLAGVDADLGDWRQAYQWQRAARTPNEQLLRSPAADPARSSCRSR